MSIQVPEKYRIRRGPTASSIKQGNNGQFLLAHPDTTDLQLFCQASNGYGWEHVSISVRRSKNGDCLPRCPTWEEMCFVKETFWEEEDVVIQYHPAKSAYCNDHPYVLHLFRPIGCKIPEPSPLLIGLGGKE